MENPYSSNGMSMSRAEMQVVLPWIFGNDLVIWPEKLPASNSNPKQTPVSLQGILETKVSAFYDFVPARFSNSTRDWQAGIKNNFFKKDLSLKDIIQLIAGETFRQRTVELRSMQDKPANSRYKQTYFSYATFSGTFEKRDNSALIQHSHCICIDLDNLVAVDAVRASIIENVDMNHFLFLFISPNGNGLKVVFFDPELKENNQAQCYAAFSKYLADISKLPKNSIDQSCKDVSRACFLPHDPQIFVNPNLVGS